MQATRAKEQPHALNALGSAFPRARLLFFQQPPVLPACPMLLPCCEDMLC